MQAITDREQRALNELYSRYGGRLKSMIGTVVHEEGDADDVLQDIMLQIWREAGKYSPKAGKPLGWVVTLTRRRAIDPRRKERLRAETDGAIRHRGSQRHFVQIRYLAVHPAEVNHVARLRRGYINAEHGSIRHAI